jgi:hypothetical protein
LMLIGFRHESDSSAPDIANQRARVQFSNSARSTGDVAMEREREERESVCV